jgi:hypothetical protein
MRACWRDYSRERARFPLSFCRPQVTKATAILLCHRFYLHQSHAKNEWQVNVCVSFVNCMHRVRLMARPDIFISEV